MEWPRVFFISAFHSKRGHILLPPSSEANSMLEHTQLCQEEAETEPPAPCGQRALSGSSCEPAKPLPTPTQSGNEALPTLDVLFRHSTPASLQLPSVPWETSHEVTQARPAEGLSSLHPPPLHFHPTQGQTGCLETPGAGPCHSGRRRRERPPSRSRDEATPHQCHRHHQRPDCGCRVMTSPGPLACPNGRARRSRTPPAAPRWPLFQSAPGPGHGLQRGAWGPCAFAPGPGGSSSLPWSRLPRCLALRRLPVSCPAQSPFCQVPAASGLRPGPALPASPGPFSSVFLTRWSPGGIPCLERVHRVEEPLLPQHPGTCSRTAW